MHRCRIRSWSQGYLLRPWFPGRSGEERARRLSWAYFVPPGPQQPGPSGQSLMFRLGRRPARAAAVVVDAALKRQSSHRTRHHSQPSVVGKEFPADMPTASTTTGSQASGKDPCSPCHLPLYPGQVATWCKISILASPPRKLNMPPLPPPNHPDSHCKWRTPCRTGSSARRIFAPRPPPEGGTEAVRTAPTSRTAWLEEGERARTGTACAR